MRKKPPTVKSLFSRGEAVPFPGLAPEVSYCEIDKPA